MQYYNTRDYKDYKDSDSNIDYFKTSTNLSLSYVSTLNSIIIYTLYLQVLKD